jgi:hypothetical protein
MKHLNRFEIRGREYAVYRDGGGMIGIDATRVQLCDLKAKWAAHLSFDAVGGLLHDVLPIDSCLNGETIRKHVFATAERLEAQLGPEQFAFDEGCQHEIEASPEPGPPITVGLDRGYIRGRERQPGGTGCFEVIAGKSIPAQGAAKVFAGVRRVDTKPVDTVGRPPWCIDLMQEDGARRAEN